MSLVSLSLVVLAAFIHATWNLLSKRAADAGPTFVFAYNLFACLVYLPWMIWLLIYGELHWNLPVAACLVLSGQALERQRPNRDTEVVYSFRTLRGEIVITLDLVIDGDALNYSNTNRVAKEGDFIAF